MGDSALREYWYHLPTVLAPAGLSPPNSAASTAAWMGASPKTQLLFLCSKRCGPQDDFMVWLFSQSWGCLENKFFQ